MKLDDQVLEALNDGEWATLADVVEKVKADPVLVRQTVRRLVSIGRVDQGWRSEGDTTDAPVPRYRLPLTDQAA